VTIKIAHLSDLHFGTEIPHLVTGVIQDLQVLQPDIIVVSGDLTQRARKSQFKKARQFLATISNAPVICVPGNHDIPLYNIVMRLISPYSNYKKFINSQLCIHHQQDQLAILGINSVTPYKPMGGYITEKQLRLVTDYFANIPIETFKIIVMHHNLIKSQRHQIINDSEKIIEIFSKANVNLVLSGHIHYPWFEQLKRGYISHNMYVITAGTAISNRTEAPNSYNVIEIDPIKKEFRIEFRNYEKGRFNIDKQEVYAW